MNVHVPAIINFQSAYAQIDAMQRKFVDRYVRDLEKEADRTGKRLVTVLNEPFPHNLSPRDVTMLGVPLVRAAIAERVRDLTEMGYLSVYKTLKELASIAYSSMGHYLDRNDFGEASIDLSECTPEQLAAIKSYEIIDMPRGGRRIKLQLHDKMGALNTTMRYQGLLSDDNAHWRNETSPVKSKSDAAKLPADIDADAAARLYAAHLENDGSED